MAIRLILLTQIKTSSSKLYFQSVHQQHKLLLYIGTYKQKTYGIYKNESQNIIHSNYIQKNNSLATGYITIYFNKKTEPLIRNIYF